MSSQYGPDGVTDFSTFTTAALEDARVRTDYSIHPIDYDRIRAELQRRKQHRRRKLQPIMEKAAGGYLLGGGVLMVGAAITFLTELLKRDPGVPLHPLAIGGLMWIWLTAALSFVAGVLILRRKPLGLRLGIVVVAAQILSFHVGQMDYRLVPIASFIVGWQMPFSLWFGLKTGPQLIAVSGTTGPLAVGVDLVSLNALLILLRGVKRARSRGPSTD